MNDTLKKVGDYKLVKRIGHGATSQVFQGRKQGSVQRFAIKMIPINGLTTKQRQMINKQVTIMKNISHPNIVQLKDTLQTTNNYYLIFQFCERGDLEHYLKQYHSPLIPQNTAQKIIYCLADAVQLIHQRGIVHRDIKLSNVLMKKDYQIKLADFGFAKEIDQNFMLQTFCGTPITMAPQILQGKNYDKKCDIWSLGVILYQLVYGKLPFPITSGYNAFVQMVTNKSLEIPSYPQMPQQFKQLLLNSLQKNPQKRYSIEQFIKNPWVQQGNTKLKIEQNKIQSVGQFLRNVSNQYTLANKSQIQQKTIGIINNQKQNKIQRLQSIISLRLYHTLIQQINKIQYKHINMRNSLLKYLSMPPFKNLNNCSQLLQLLYFLDYSYLNHLFITPITICTQTDQKIYQLAQLANLQTTKTLSKQQPPNMQGGLILLQHLRIGLTVQKFTNQQKKKYYQLALNFLELMRRFTLKIQIIFANRYYHQVSLNNVISNMRNKNFSEKQDSSEGNYVTIALECKQKDQKMKQLRDMFKDNIQKRLQQIDKQINGYFD